MANTDVQMRTGSVTNVKLIALKKYTSNMQEPAYIQI